MAKILLVEDNEMNRDMLTRRLERKGYTVIAAIDGPSGIEMARTSLPDIILMDVALGDMDGWEATRVLKADEETRHIPIVALTGHALAGASEGARKAGCDSFVTKPCLPDDLVVEVKRMLNTVKQG